MPKKICLDQHFIAQQSSANSQIQQHKSMAISLPLRLDYNLYIKTYIYLYIMKHHK